MAEARSQKLLDLLNDPEPNKLTATLALVVGLGVTGAGVALVTWDHLLPLEVVTLSAGGAALALVVPAVANLRRASQTANALARVAAVTEPEKDDSNEPPRGDIVQARLSEARATGRNMLVVAVLLLALAVVAADRNKGQPQDCTVDIRDERIVATCEVD